VYWSPYQKLEVFSIGDNQYQIDVNNVGYMSIANATPDFVTRHPELAKQLESSSYDSPFRFAANTNRVLVIGAGAGNDAAVALRHGADYVDAIEIDPLIYSIGKRLHPEHPYDSPKVHVVINDARNFLRQDHEKYDMIVFGLLDSHTGFSGYSNVRVDNYVYTEESFRDARRLLKPDGILYLSWRVTDGADQRDPVGRLYTAFDGELVRQSLGGAALLLDDEPMSVSSGKKIHRMVARKVR